MKPQPASSIAKTIVLVAAFGLFAAWGLALWLYNALFITFSNFFAFSSVQLAWMLSLYSVVYFLLAIPAALFHHQFGYKLGLLFGLSIFAMCAFLLYLAIIQHSSVFFVGAVIMLGFCGAWLDTSLNPLAVEAGDQASAVKRLNLAHAFSGLGLLAGCIGANRLVEAHYQLSAGAAAQLSARPYVLIGLGAILFAFFFEQVKLPDFATNRAAKDLKPLAEIRPLLKSNNFAFACLALAAYSVALTVIWSAHSRYNAQEQPGHILILFERGFFWFVAGRWIGTVVMRWIDPLRLLQWCAGLCAIALIAASVVGGYAGWACLLCASLFLSITFPTVTGTALSGQGIRTKIAGGLLPMAAGIGNALAPFFAQPMMHLMNIRVEILLALPFVAVIFAYAWIVLARRNHSKPGAASQTGAGPSVAMFPPVAG